MSKNNTILPFSKNPRALLLTCALCTTSAAFGDVIYQQDFENWDNSDGLWSNPTKSVLGDTYTTVLGRFSNTTVSLNIQAPTDTGGGNPNGNSFNITLDQLEDNRSPMPVHDSLGGGQGQSGPSIPPDPNIPQLNLGGAVQGQNTGGDGTGGTTQLYTAGVYALEFDMLLFDSWDGNDNNYGLDIISIKVNDSKIFEEVFMARTDDYVRWVPDEVPEFNVFDEHWDSIFRDIRIIFEIAEDTDHLNFDFLGQQSQDIEDESWGIDNILIEQISSFRTTTTPAPGTLALFGASMGMIARRKR